MPSNGESTSSRSLLIEKKNSPTELVFFKRPDPEVTVNSERQLSNTNYQFISGVNDTLDDCSKSFFLGGFSEDLLFRNVVFHTPLLWWRMPFFFRCVEFLETSRRSKPQRSQRRHFFPSVLNKKAYLKLFQIVNNKG